MRPARNCASRSSAERSGVAFCRRQMGTVQINAITAISAAHAGQGVARRLSTQAARTNPRPGPMNNECRATKR